MAEAAFFNDPDYPVPGHGKTWLATTRDGATLRFASWRPTVKPVRGTIVLTQGRAEFIERYSETIAELRRRGFHVLALTGAARAARSASFAASARAISAA